MVVTGHDADKGSSGDGSRQRRYPMVYANRPSWPPLHDYDFKTKEATVQRRFCLRSTRVIRRRSGGGSVGFLGLDQDFRFEAAGSVGL